MRRLFRSLAAAALGLLAVGAAPPAPPTTAAPPVWKVAVGEPFPPIELERIGGGRERLPRKGEVAVINVFASWCGPCRMEMPKLESEIWRELSPRGLVVYGVDRGEPAPLVRSFVERMEITYPVLLDPEKRFFDLVSANGVGIPKTIVVGRDGRIAWLENGFVPGGTIPNLRAKLEELLPPPVGRP